MVEYDMVIRAARRLVRDDNRLTAEDVAQEAYLALHGREIAPEFMKVAVKRACIDALREVLGRPGTAGNAAMARTRSLDELREQDDTIGIPPFEPSRDDGRVSGTESAAEILAEMQRNHPELYARAIALVDASGAVPGVANGYNKRREARVRLAAIFRRQFEESLA